MKRKVGRQVGRIPYRRINTISAGGRDSKTGKTLHEPQKTNNQTYAQSYVEKQKPVLFGLKDANQQNKVKIEMKKHHKPLHPLKIGKKLAIRVWTKKIGEEKNYHKNGHRFENQGQFWTISALHGGKTNPKHKSNFYKKSKKEVFSGNKRKKHPVRDIEWKYQDRKDTNLNTP